MYNQVTQMELFILGVQWLWPSVNTPLWVKHL